MRNEVHFHQDRRSSHFDSTKCITNCNKIFHRSLAETYLKYSVQAPTAIFSCIICWLYHFSFPWEAFIKVTSSQKDSWIKKASSKSEWPVFLLLLFLLIILEIREETNLHETIINLFIHKDMNHAWSVGILAGCMRRKVDFGAVSACSVNKQKTLHSLSCMWKIV